MIISLVLLLQTTLSVLVTKIHLQQVTMMIYYSSVILNRHSHSLGLLSISLTKGFLVVKFIQFINNNYRFSKHELQIVTEMHCRCEGITTTISLYIYFVSPVSGI